MDLSSRWRSAPAGNTALYLDGALQPSCTPLEDPVLQREEGQPPLTPTGKDPCLRIFPGDDFIRKPKSLAE
jgi:hypothetical protein